MSLELINTLGTVTTVVIVAAAAMVQLRHLRAGNQINAILNIEAEFSEQAFIDAQALVTGNSIRRSTTQRFATTSSRDLVAKRRPRWGKPTQICTKPYIAWQTRMKNLGFWLRTA